MDVKYKHEIIRIKSKAVSRSSSVGIFMLVSSVLSYAFMWLYNGFLYGFFERHIMSVSDGISSVFGFSRLEASVVLKEIFYSGILDEIFTMLSMLLCVFLPAYLMGKLWEISVSDCFVTEGKLVKGVVFIYAFCQLIMLCITNMADGIWKFFFPSGIGDVPQSQGFYSDNEFVLIVSFLCTCIMVPVLEEYVFRGVVFGLFRQSGLGYAVIASSLCFGLMHNSVLQFVYAFAFGLVSAMLVVVTGNIKTSVLFHILNNTVSFLSAFLPRHFGEGAETAFNAAHIIFVLSFSFYGMYLFFAKNGVLSGFVKQADAQLQNSGYTAKLSYLLSPPFVLYVILFAVQNVLEVI